MRALWGSEIFALLLQRAPDPVRAVADHVTASNDEDENGAALALERFVLQSQR